jgi:hypothetical protein
MQPDCRLTYELIINEDPRAHECVKRGSYAKLVRPRIIRVYLGLCSGLSMPSGRQLVTSAAESSWTSPPCRLMPVCTLVCGERISSVSLKERE